MAAVFGFLLVGVADLAFVTHATSYVHEYPSVLSQVACSTFSDGIIGNIFIPSYPEGIGCYVVQRCEHQFQRIAGVGQLCGRKTFTAKLAGEKLAPASIFE